MIHLFYNSLFPFLKTDSKRIIFESNLGKNYSGNPKAIYEEMVKQGLDKHYTCVWVFQTPNQSVPGRHKQIKKLRLRYLIHAIKAKYWVVDTRQPPFIKKKRSVMFVQTWHGTPLKRLGFDMNQLNMGGDQDLSRYQEGMKISANRWDVLVAQNTYSANIFPSAFHYSGDVLVSGYPRNDQLVRYTEEDASAIKKRLGLPLDKQILLYAPTWRDNHYIKKGHYRFSTGIDFDRLEEALGQEFIILIKTHYLISEDVQFDSGNQFVHTFDYTQDITDLYIVADCLMTDYSSVMFDYSVTRRPMIFYVHDYESYRDQLRGFYFDLFEEAPGPVVRTTEEVIKSLKRMDETSAVYEEAYTRFVNKYNHLDDGYAADRVIQYMLKSKK